MTSQDVGNTVKRICMIIKMGVVLFERCGQILGIPGIESRVPPPCHYCHFGLDTATWWGCLGHCDRFSSIPGPYPLDANGASQPDWDTVTTEIAST